MLALIQRVTHANVVVDNEVCANIKQGILLLCGFEEHDTLESTLKLIDKCTKYRMFSDLDGKMNWGLSEVNGEMLVVPQFTLAADTKKGLRPSFSSSLRPASAQRLFEQIKNELSKISSIFSFGIFGADMQVTLCNDGPATFLLKN